jgi:thioredoxin 1
METFKDIINSDKPVLVDFFATWCGPCRAIMPTVEALSKEYKDKIRVIKIDIDKNEELSNQYKIQMVPTFIIFQKGEVLWRKSGILDRATLEQEIQNRI